MRIVRLNSEHGMATLIALIMVAMLTLLGLAALSTSDDEISITANELQETRAFYAAEAGLEKAIATMYTEYDTTGTPPLVLPSGTDELNNCLVTYSTVDDGSAVMKNLTSGSLVGLHALVKSFAITSTASSSMENSRVQLSQSFEVALIPIFQFAVFYENDLWASPIYDMIINGRTHVNGNMYLQANTGLYFDGKVTAAGSIYHGLANGMSPSFQADVCFKDRVGLYRSMKEGGSWLDAGNPNWYDSASTRWGGTVQDHAFGQESLNLPLTGASADPHKMIERASGNPDSYESKATFKVMDGVPYAKIGGVWQDVTSFLPAGTITNSSFYDGREYSWVNSTDIDIEKLESSSYFPSNGVIYTSDQQVGYNGTRLKNGEDIGRPLTVVSENPVYVQGDYNSKNKQPAAVVGDVVTFLSNNWDDSKSHLSLNQRTPTTTTANVCIISGDSEPTSTNYGGGLENLPRFLENWKSKTFKLRGSMVNLWRSHQASGPWRYYSPDPYYTAPTRDWGFDTDLNDPNKLPPETPMVRVFLRTGWQQHHVGYNDQGV
jgi:hypothetical protein